MVALVENVAERAFGGGVIGFLSAKSIPCRLCHDERMVRNHDGGAPRAPQAALNEADAVMRASGIDAFATPVSEFA
jgi:hypothetical protein